MLNRWTNRLCLVGMLVLAAYSVGGIYNLLRADVTKVTFSSAGAAATVQTVFGNRMVVCDAKTLSTTTATVQPVATITTTSNTGGTVTGFFSTTAYQATTAMNVDAIIATTLHRNLGGTVAGAMTAGVDAGSSDSSGTLATQASVTLATNVVTINVTPAWVTIVPTSVIGRYVFIVNGSDTLVCV